MKKWIASAAVASAMMLTPLQAFANIGDQTLRPGMTHSDVKQLQQLLKNQRLFHIFRFTDYILRHLFCICSKKNSKHLKG
ncbi:hypothetical protein RCO48_25515 [Peribacillus frigoritolerans]|nr:hypothetical protein [Peribacillus frigoritolerans]